TYLEIEGVITATRPFHSTYQARPLRDFDGILAGYDDRRKSFLRRIFAAATAGRSWTTFAIDEVALATGSDRRRIVAALVHLEEAGDIALKKSGVRQGYRLLRDPGDLHALARRLGDQFRRREEADLARLAHVVALAETPGCLTGFVTAHFGETLASPCGHCDRCRGVAPRPVPRSAAVPPAAEDLEAIGRLVAERHAALRTPRQLARFLAGIGSPALTRARLTRHDRYGLLEDTHLLQGLGHLQPMMLRGRLRWSLV